jgi:hypothetical protein
LSPDRPPGGGSGRGPSVAECLEAGSYYLERGDFEASRAWLQYALRLDPYNQRAHERLEKLERRVARGGLATGDLPPLPPPPVPPARPNAAVIPVLGPSLVPPQIPPSHPGGGAGRTPPGFGPPGDFGRPSPGPVGVGGGPSGPGGGRPTTARSTAPEPATLVSHEMAAARAQRGAAPAPPGRGGVGLAERAADPVTWFRAAHAVAARLPPELERQLIGARPSTVPFEHSGTFPGLGPEWGGAPPARDWGLVPSTAGLSALPDLGVGPPASPSRDLPPGDALGRVPTRSGVRTADIAAAEQWSGSGTGSSGRTSPSAARSSPEAARAGWGAGGLPVIAVPPWSPAPGSSADLPLGGGGGPLAPPRAPVSIAPRAPVPSDPLDFVTAGAEAPRPSGSTSEPDRIVSPWDSDRDLASAAVSEAPGPMPERRTSGGVGLARSRLALDDVDGALDALGPIGPGHPERAEAERLTEAIEARLLAICTTRVGSLSRAPEVILRDQQLIWMSMNHRVGYLLSQIDGRMTYEDLIALSGMSKADTLRILCRLLAEGVIGHPGEPGR